MYNSGQMTLSEIEKQAGRIKPTLLATTLFEKHK